MASEVVDSDGQPAQSAAEFGRLQARYFADGFSFSGYERDLVSLNRGDGTFLDISGVSGADSISDGRGSVFADFDNDGDSDIFLRAMHGEAHLLFRNNLGSQSAFVRVTLEGTTSGRDAFGAEVRIKTSAGVQTRVKSGGTGFVSSSDPRLLFGLGEDRSAQWLEIRWPSGLEQRFPGPAAGDSWLLVEGKAEPRELSERRFSLPNPPTAKERRWHSVGLEPSQQLADVTLHLIDGEQRTLSSFIKDDEALLVNFWATWCRPCAAEMPELQRLFQSGMPVVGISVDRPETRSAIPHFVEDLGITYPVVTIERKELERLLGTTDPGVPLSVVIDSDLRARDLFAGWSEETREELNAKYLRSR